MCCWFATMRLLYMYLLMWDQWVGPMGGTNGWVGILHSPKTPQTPKTPLQPGIQATVFAHPLRAPAGPEVWVARGAFLRLHGPLTGALDWGTRRKPLRYPKRPKGPYLRTLSRREHVPSLRTVETRGLWSVGGLGASSAFEIRGFGGRAFRASVL